MELGRPGCPVDRLPDSPRHERGAARCLLGTGANPKVWCNRLEGGYAKGPVTASFRLPWIYPASYLLFRYDLLSIVGSFHRHGGDQCSSSGGAHQRRLPPDPAPPPADRPKLLYRFAAVCRTWRSLLTDPAFLRRYREFHGLPHLIGYVHDGADGRDLVVARFVTTADTTFRPRVPEKGVDLHVLDSRHGRVIFRRIGKGWLDESSLIIWDPVADHHQEVPLPEAFAQEEFNLTATVLCDALGCDHLDCHGGPFRVVFVGVRDEEGASATSAFNYTSSSGSWTASPAAAAAVADEDDWGFRMPAPSILVGGTTLYFRSPGRILRYWFGDEMEHLSYVDIPPFITQETRGTVLMPAADGRLSFAAMYGDMTISFWETEVSADGAVDWVHTQNALVSIPLPGVLIGAAASLLFVRTEDGLHISVANTTKVEAEVQGGDMADLDDFQKKSLLRTTDYVPDDLG
uniref:F-box domain-containing protein n=1 Tax=Oryza sativa subsp. japonica TaxID=39947 RepID=Q94GT1_ORYSJ|nr:Unknown protein [Oryza sativa]AAN04136.1 Unknown protein [Oryza sativa Japonica Group]